jgi:hypothetical protein
MTRCVVCIKPFDQARAQNLLQERIVPLKLRESRNKRTVILLVGTSGWYVSKESQSGKEDLMLYIAYIGLQEHDTNAARTFMSWLLETSTMDHSP